MEGSFSLIDNATPQDARTKVSPVDGRTMQLVFSDEFEQDGRTFWPVSETYRPMHIVLTSHRAMTPSGKPRTSTTG